MSEEEKERRKRMTKTENWKLQAKKAFNSTTTYCTFSHTQKHTHPCSIRTHKAVKRRRRQFHRVSPIVVRVGMEAEQRPWCDTYWRRRSTDQEKFQFIQTTHTFGCRIYSTIYVPLSHLERTPAHQTGCGNARSKKRIASCLDSLQLFYLCTRAMVNGGDRSCFSRVCASARRGLANSPSSTVPLQSILHKQTSRQGLCAHSQVRKYRQPTVKQRKCHLAEARLQHWDKSLSNQYIYISMEREVDGICSSDISYSGTMTPTNSSDSRKKKKKKQRIESK